MSESRALDEPAVKGIRLTLHKSVDTEHRSSSEGSFSLWGAFDFLYFGFFHSLSEFSQPGNKDYDENDLERFPLTENRSLYIYKNNEINLYPELETDWIFRNNEEYPLIIITLVKGNLKQIYAKVQAEPATKHFKFDIFQTIGQSTGAIVFRSKTYTHILNCIVTLNSLSEHTYSIAGVRLPPSMYPPPGKLLFPMLIESNSSDSEFLTDYAVIQYLLREDRKPKDRVKKIHQRISEMQQMILAKFPDQKLKIQQFTEIGRFDLLIFLEGHIALILELLLNPKYGLTYESSNFYRTFIAESQTSWLTSSKLD